MTTFFHDVLLLEEHALVEIGIKVGLHSRIGQIGGPADEVIHRFLGAIGVINFQTIALRHQVVAHHTQAVGSLTGDKGSGLHIAIDSTTNEIVGAIVANFKNGIGHRVGNVNKLATVIGRVDRIGRF